MGVVQQAGEECRQRVVGDAQGGGQNVDVHDDFGEDERRGGSVETIAAREKVGKDDRDAGAGDIPDGEPLVFVGSGRERGTGGPKSVDHDSKQQDR